MSDRDLTHTTQRLRRMAKHGGFDDTIACQLADAADAIETLSAEVKESRDILCINTITGRAYYCDPFNKRQTTYTAARAATDAHFKDLP